MSDAAAAEPRRRIYYVHTRATRRHDRSCHHHRVFDAGHELIARGYLHRTFQPSPVAFGGDPDQPDVIIELRKSFPLTGKVDLRDAYTGALLGVATRGYQLYGAAGERLARFEDAGPRRPIGRALAQFALDVACDSDGIGSPSASQHFVLTYLGEPLGALRRCQLPFFPDVAIQHAPSRLSNALRRFLPSRMHTALRATPPSGWTFALNEGASGLVERTMLCFVLTTIELDNWKST